MMRLKVLLLILGITLGLGIHQVVFRKEPADAISAPAVSGLATGLEPYAPKHFSEQNEEVIIRHFFRDAKNGYFLDVGAYHYKDKSNTYYLEKYLGWTGIAIDANAEFARGYLENRPGTKFFSFFVSDKSDETVDFYIVRDPGHLTKSTGVEGAVGKRKTEDVKVPTVALNDLLAKLGVTKINFFNLDIELWEPRALAGFDIEKYKPDLVCVEAHHQVRDKILGYFTQRGYVRMDFYFLVDQRNWYFTPKENYDKIFDVSY